MIVPPIEHKSPMRAAGFFSMSTVIDPFAIGWGGKFAAGGAIMPRHMSVIRAAGNIQTNTVGAHGPRIGRGAPSVQGCRPFQEFGRAQFSCSSCQAALESTEKENWSADDDDEMYMLLGTNVMIGARRCTFHSLFTTY